MWAGIVNTLVGIWLTAAPEILAYGDPARTNDRIVGPLVASFAFVSLWEATRPLRWVNLAFGLWLLASPWVLGDSGWTGAVNETAAGLILSACSLVRGKITKRYGGGWSSLLRRGGP